MPKRHGMKSRATYQSCSLSWVDHILQFSFQYFGSVERNRISETMGTMTFRNDQAESFGRIVRDGRIDVREKPVRRKSELSDIYIYKTRGETPSWRNLRCAIAARQNSPSARWSPCVSALWLPVDIRGVLAIGVRNRILLSSKILGFGVSKGRTGNKIC